MASLQQRGTKWVIYARNENGNPQRYATGCDLNNRAGAERKLAEFIEERKLGKIDRYRKHRRRTLQDHAEDYFKYQVSIDITEKQAKEVKRRVLRVLNAAGIKRIEDVTESRIQVAVAKMRQLPRSKKKSEADMPLLSARGKNQHRKAIYAFCRWLYRDHRVAIEPLRQMKMDNEEADPRHQRTALTDNEFAALYSTAAASDRTIEGFDGTTRARAYLLSAMTGLRRSELASLTRRSFAWGSDPLVTVQAAFSKHRKTDKVRIPKTLIRDLKRWIISLEPDEPLFPKLGQRRTCKMIRRDLESAGILYQDEEGRYRDWHALRHTYVTRAWRSGATPGVIQRLARHEDIRTTMRYSHATEDDLRAAVEATPMLPLISA